jgi:hypothetical protein
MKFSIFPLKGVNQIKFSMTFGEVRALMGSEPKSFKKGPQDTFPTDYFDSEGVFFFYDGDGRLEAAEFAQPAQPIVADLNILGLGFGEALAILTSLDNHVEKQVDGAIAYQLGISIYAPLAKGDMTAPVETVLVFRPGYYN